MADDPPEEGFCIDAWGFEDRIELDSRLVCSLGDLGFSRPTDVQLRSIPLIYEAKNVYMQCRTGSGKTAAYLIPVIERIFRSTDQGVKALVLAPTRDLSWQITSCAERLLAYSEVKVVDLCKFSETRGHEVRRGDFSIVVATPTKALSFVKKKYIDPKRGLDIVVLDEADLILSYGYQDDTRELLSLIPRGYQICMASATLNADLGTLSGIALKDLEIVRLDSVSKDTKVRHYYVISNKQDRYLYLCYVLKFRMNPFGSGKTIIFVKDTDEGYRLRILLNLFGIRCCSLNPNLPIESRAHIIQEFNKGIYDYIVAVDQHASAMTGITEPSVNSKITDRAALNYGSARGMDFKRVDSVINFDFPLDSVSYIHRAGRTGRALYKKGCVLSFFIAPSALNSTDLDAELKGTALLDVISACKSRNIMLEPFSFCSDDMEPFRYRVENTLRAVNKRAVKYAKIAEIKTEILNSEKLKSLLESDTRLLSSLRHDSSLVAAKVEMELSHVPKYLLPKCLSSQAISKKSTSSCVGALSHVRTNAKRYRKHKKPHLDPLKSFKCT